MGADEPSDAIDIAMPPFAATVVVHRVLQQAAHAGSVCAAQTVPAVQDGKKCCQYHDGCNFCLCANGFKLLSACTTRVCNTYVTQTTLYARLCCRATAEATPAMRRESCWLEHTMALLPA